tara:strand:- start:3847 stop:5964 length:2118 start_codon:yes stop_codon:yes gene_type:complete
MAVIATAAALMKAAKNLVPAIKGAFTGSISSNATKTVGKSTTANRAQPVSRSAKDLVNQVHEKGKDASKPNRRGNLTLTELAKIQGVSFAAGAATESIRKLDNTMKSMLKVNERLAVVNSTLAKESAMNSKALINAEQGFGLAAQAMTEFRILGFKGSNKEMINLATRMKISGQDYGKMMKNFQDLLGKGGVNEKGIDHLAKTIKDNAIIYGTTTDSLIDALGALGKNLLDLNITGGSLAASETATKLAAMVGPAYAEEAGRFVSLIASMDKDKIDITARLGVEPWGDRISSNIVDSKEEMINSLSMINSSLRSGVGEKGVVQRRSFGALKPVYGEAGILGSILHDAAQKQLLASEKNINVIDQIKETVEHLKATFMAPFQIALAEMSPAFKTLGKSLIMFGGSLLNIIASLAPVITVIMDIVSGILRVFALIFQAVAIGINTITLGFVSVEGAYDSMLGRDSVTSVELDEAKMNGLISGMGQIWGKESPMVDTTKLTTVDITKESVREMFTTSPPTVDYAKLTSSVVDTTKLTTVDVTKAAVREMVDTTKLTSSVVDTTKLTSSVADNTKLNTVDVTKAAVSAMTSAIGIDRSFGKSSDLLRQKTAIASEAAAESLEKMVTLTEEEHKSGILQDLETLRNNNSRDVDARYFAIADAVAVEQNATLQLLGQLLHATENNREEVPRTPPATAPTSFATTPSQGDES